MRFLFSIIVIVSCFIAEAKACSCVGPADMTLEQHFTETEVIFRGAFLGADVADVESVSMLNKAGRFRVIEVLKGEIKERAAVYYSEDNGANCGLTFEPGTEYEIFAWIDAEGRIVTSDCSGTRTACGAYQWPWDDYRQISKKH